MAQAETAKQNSPIPNDVDPAETAEWLESLDYVLERKGPELVQQLLTALEQAAIRNGV
jgi:pyruvate dehydrogenase E1 component